ncbi:hypothetical protein D3C87_934560 [compost metagenome]
MFLFLFVMVRVDTNHRLYFQFRSVKHQPIGLIFLFRHFEQSATESRNLIIDLSISLRYSRDDDFFSNGWCPHRPCI